MASEAICGIPGTGKTLNAVFRACIALSRGKTVYSNLVITDNVFGSGNKSKMYNNIEEFLGLSDALVVIDEASLVFNSRFFAKTPPDIMSMFAQQRKDGLHLLYTSQSFKHVDNRLRDNTQWVWNAIRLGRDEDIFDEIPPEPNGFRYDCYPAASVNVNKDFSKIMRRKFHFLMPHFYYKMLFDFRYIKNLLPKLYSSYETKYKILQNFQDHDDRHNQSKGQTYTRSTKNT